MEDILEPEPPVVVNGDAAPYVDSIGMTVDPTQEAEGRERRAQENEWDKIKVRWAPETRHQVMSEFLRDKGLYAELAKFARKRAR